jgi:hypothetical protein
MAIMMISDIAGQTAEGYTRVLETVQTHYAGRRPGLPDALGPPHR